jgi:DNA-directed RNA polymerase sigma subunit (sigma70/sigma32)
MTTLDQIAELTSALISQSDATASTAATRVALIRQARADGETLEAIGNVAGITKQRVAQLAQTTEGK